MQSIADILKDNANAWNAAVLGDNATVKDIPEGLYKAEIVGAKIIKTKADIAKVVWNFKLVEGEHKDSKAAIFNSLEGEYLIHLKKNLVLCGIELDDITKLQSALKKVTGYIAEITVKKRGDYVNTYLNKILEKPQKEEIAVSAEEEAPF